MDKVIVLDYLLWHQFLFKWIRPGRMIHSYIVSSTKHTECWVAIPTERNFASIYRESEIYLLFQFESAENWSSIANPTPILFMLSNKIEEMVEKDSKINFYLGTKRKLLTDQINKYIYLKYICIICPVNDAQCTMYHQYVIYLYPVPRTTYIRVSINNKCELFAFLHFNNSLVLNKWMKMIDSLFVYSLTRIHSALFFSLSTAAFLLFLF